MWLIDQTSLPLEVRWIECETYQRVEKAIKHLEVRGAPAIGVAAAYGVVLSAQCSGAKTRDRLLRDVSEAVRVLAATRPTAVNLFWGLQRMQRVGETQVGGVEEIKEALFNEANAMAREDEERNRHMGGLGAGFIHDGDTILTHCNAGSLATVAYGTALGVIRTAHEQGKRIHVYVDETRPVLQGARLTAWELQKDGIPVTLITDNMAGYLMGQGKINLAIVGADRIAANGDVANKIGTYSVAVLAAAHGIPFYVVAPTSSIDISLPNGKAIRIEERSPDEVTSIGGVQIAPHNIDVFNPAFDVTPHRYIKAIVTEQGVTTAPFEPALRQAVEAASR